MSLETIYLAFIQPILEYGDIFLANCTQYEKGEFEKIQTKAARIATGTTKLLSRDAFYMELYWESLNQRRKHHQFTLFYKMINPLVPAYLTALIPQSGSIISRYNLRNLNDLQTNDDRTYKC